MKGFRAMLVAAFAVAVVNAPAWAQVEAKSAWVRGTVGAQKTTSAYMELKSAKDGVLVGVESSAAGIAEVHEMRMEQNVMRMRAVPKLDLPAGRTVTLKPGGYHVMLMDLRKPLKKGDSVLLKLAIENKDKSVATVEVAAEVRDATAAAPAGQH
jgi:copper(I)-binding protein